MFNQDQCWAIVEYILIFSACSFKRQKSVSMIKINTLLFWIWMIHLKIKTAWIIDRVFIRYKEGYVRKKKYWVISLQAENKTKAKSLHTQFEMEFKFTGLITSESYSMRYKKTTSSLSVRIAVWRGYSVLALNIP